MPIGKDYRLVRGEAREAMPRAEDREGACNLSAGGHHFRILQMSGSFFFLSLTVWRV